MVSKFLLGPAASTTWLRGVTFFNLLLLPWLATTIRRGDLSSLGDTGGTPLPLPGIGCLMHSASPRARGAMTRAPDADRQVSQANTEEASSSQGPKA